MDAGELAARFALGTRARLSDGPVARGKQGAVWRVETSDGRWAVKVPFGTSTDDEVAESTALQEAAHAAGVPTPQVRRTTDGAIFATTGGTRVRLYEWVDLLPPDPLLDPELVGAALGVMHQVPFDGATTPDPWSQDPVGAERWDGLVRDLREAGAPFAERLAALRDELVALEGWLEPPGQLRACHRDVWADNLLPTPGGGICVVDWDNGGAADPAQELGCALFEFARTDPGRVRALVHAYRYAGGPARVSRRGHFSMLIAQLGHITEIAGRDWLVPNLRSPERAESEAWIAETLDDPHTREVLDQLLLTAREAATSA